MRAGIIKAHYDDKGETEDKWEYFNKKFELIVKVTPCK
jgi:hypothetical protein